MTGPERASHSDELPGRSRALARPETVHPPRAVRLRAGRAEHGRRDQPPDPATGFVVPAPLAHRDPVDRRRLRHRVRRSAHPGRRARRPPRPQGRPARRARPVRRGRRHQRVRVRPGGADRRPGHLGSGRGTHHPGDDVDPRPPRRTRPQGPGDGVLDPRPRPRRPGGQPGRRPGRPVPDLAGPVRRDGPAGGAAGAGRGPDHPAHRPLPAQQPRPAGHPAAHRRAGRRPLRHHRGSGPRLDLAAHPGLVRCRSTPGRRLHPPGPALPRPLLDPRVFRSPPCGQPASAWRRASSACSRCSSSTPSTCRT